ncbi:MAG: hypothetical protein L0G87_00505 [Renibacterium salmoninarum]|nr:hypothetical protein [Renibacterium salmoninarum]
MLKILQRFWLVVVLAIIALSFSATSAVAAGNTVCDDEGNCTVVVDDGGKPGGGGTTGSGGGGFTPGPTSCADKAGKEIECSKDGAPYNAAKGCYLKVADPQKPPPPGKDAAQGAWYTCSSFPPCEQSDLGAVTCTNSSVDFWSDTPPPGISTYTPAQAAAQLVKTFQLRGIDIGIVPKDTPGSVGTVGLPVWMWVNNPQPLTYGPYSVTAAIGGVSITATARVTNIAWNMGDGNTVNCAGTGTPWNGTNTPSPDCGYRYQNQSVGQPGNAYQVTATSSWVVEWSGAGQTGQIPMQTVSRTQLQIGEIQTIIKG